MNWIYKAALLTPMLGLVACATPELDLDPTLTHYSRATLEDAPIEMPANYSTDTFRKLTMGVAFSSISGVDKKTGKPLSISTGLSSRMQTEMAKLKRFTIFSAHNRGGVSYFQSLSDVEGDVNLAKPVDAKKLDYILSGSVIVTKERQDRYNDTIVIYEVECDFSCEDLKTRTVKFAEKAKGRTARKQILSYSGRALAGHDSSDEEQAITQAALKALAVMANKLGNTFPVGGRIVGASSSGDRIQLNKGFEDGIGAKQQCVIYVDDGGVDIPVGLAEASPSSTTSNLNVYRWNDGWGQKDAQVIIDAYKENPKSYIRKNKVYAVGYGLSVPPEWDNANKGSMDEQLRLK